MASSSLKALESDEKEAIVISSSGEGWKYQKSKPQVTVTADPQTYSVDSSKADGLTIKTQDTYKPGAGGGGGDDDGGGNKTAIIVGVVVGVVVVIAVIVIVVIVIKKKKAANDSSNQNNDA